MSDGELFVICEAGENRDRAFESAKRLSFSHKVVAASYSGQVLIVMQKKQWYETSRVLRWLFDR